MSRIILKSRYLRAGSKQHSEHLIQYIAKREGVQKIDDTWKHQPATKEQKKLIADLLRDFPEVKDSFEYADYLAKPNKGTASELISRAIDDNVDLIGKRENYVSYIAKRPRAERHGAHGLFTDADVPINLSQVAAEVANHDGNVWTHIISLRREDAARLGYDNAYAWRNLLRSQAETIAENMKIPLTDLKWYAAYHDESYHPHVHMVVYSTGKEPYLTKQGICNLKAAFAKQIFRHDLLQVYVEQTNQRNELTGRSRDILSDIITRINSGSYDDPVVTELLLKLSQQLQNHKGKKVYGYLPQAGRNLVNAVVDELAKNPEIAALYDLWYAQRDTIIGTYQDTPERRIPLSQNKEFKAIKNAVIQESLNVQQAQNIQAPASTGAASMRLLTQLAQLIQNDAAFQSENAHRTDRKLRRKLQEKKQAQGLKMETDLVAFLQRRGEGLKRSGSEYEWRDGAQKVTIRGNVWFHQYERVGGDAIDFVRRFYGMDYPQAVELLLDGCSGFERPTQHAAIQQKSTKDFLLPKRNNTMRRVYAYLLQQRGIDREVLNAFVREGMIYESAEHHNAVFVGYDQDGVARHAHKRGTNSQSSYKGNQDGSRPEFSFHWCGQSNRLYFFEAPIDLLSFISLNKTNWQDHSYAAAGFPTMRSGR